MLDKKRENVYYLSVRQTQQTKGGYKMGNSIKELRAKRNLTQESLAKKAKISRTHLAEIENGKAIPSVIVAQNIAKVLKVKIENIFFDNSVV